MRFIPFLGLSLTLCKQFLNPGGSVKDRVALQSKPLAL